MKLVFETAIVCLILVLFGCQNETQIVENDNSSPSAPDTNQIVDRIVEASCGQCQFGMDGDGCDLAIRIDSKPYFVDGSSIDDHGDAHGDDGLCNCIRRAKVTGEIKDERFVATAVEVLPSEK